MSRNTQITFSVSAELYPIEAIVSACYSFLDKAYISLDQAKPGKVAVRIKAKKGNVARMKDDFMNELLFTTERLNAVKRNKRTREFIVGKALFGAVEGDSSIPADDDNMADDDFSDDPLDIKIPWKE